MKIFSLLIFISYFCLFDCLAGNSENDSFFFSKVGYQQGLSNSAVISVFQDSAGLMWFGTYDGVNCYDGRDMDVYRSDFSTNLSNNVIYRIRQADSNCLWITTGAGQNRFSPVLRKVVGTYELPSETVCIPTGMEIHGSSVTTGYAIIIRVMTALWRWSALPW